MTTTGRRLVPQRREAEALIPSGSSPKRSGKPGTPRGTEMNALSYPRLKFKARAIR